MELDKVALDRWITNAPDPEWGRCICSHSEEDHDICEDHKEEVGNCFVCDCVEYTEQEYPEDDPDRKYDGRYDE